MEGRIMPGQEENPGAMIETGKELQDREMSEKPKIDSEAVRKAEAIRKKYAEGIRSVHERIKKEYEWYNLQSEIKGEEDGQVKPVSSQLFNAMANKHADAVDCLPHPNFQAHEKGDEEEAKRLSSVVPVLLKLCKFKKVWSRVWLDKIISGTGIYGVFWDSTAENGLGQLNIVQMNPLNLFWEPGIEDIQKSRNFFSVELWDNDDIRERWPEAGESLGNRNKDIVEYGSEENQDDAKKTYVVDWYYKKLMGGKTILHYVRYIGDTVIYASENTSEYGERGIYDHGRYPFVFDTLYPMKNSPAGIGYVAIGRNTQEYNERLKKALLENAMWGAKPRYFVKKSSGVNKEDFADQSKFLIEVEGGSLDDSGIRPITVSAFPSIYYSLLTEGKEDLKEVTANRDVATGGSTGGVTAASAIAAMQEAGSKLSREHISMGFDAFEEVCVQVIEILRQFYNLKRWFRITGENGKNEYVQYSNQALVPQTGMTASGEETVRVPEFDIDISAEKESPYSRMSRNEMALEFYKAGFFDPNNVDQSLATIDMMDFDGKEKVTETIAYNGTMLQKYQQLSKLAMAAVSELDTIKGTSDAQMLAAKLGMDAQQAMPGDASMPKEAAESSVTASARARVAEAAVPR